MEEAYIKLSLCPFCAEEAEFELVPYRDKKFVKVTCTLCKAGSRLFMLDPFSKKERYRAMKRAADVWNRRLLCDSTT